MSYEQPVYGLQTPEDIARSITQSGRGIVDVSENIESLNARLTSHGVSRNLKEKRRTFRETIITAEAIGSYVGGMIMNKEGYKQSSSRGQAFISSLHRRHIAPILLLDDDSLITKRAAKDVSAFAIRDPKEIDKSSNSKLAFSTSANKSVEVAKASHDAGKAIVIGAELFGRGHHSFNQSYDAQAGYYDAIISKLDKAGVDLSGVVLIGSIATPGIYSSEETSLEQIGSRNGNLINDLIPATIGGLALSSDNPDSVKATQLINEVNNSCVNISPSFVYSPAFADSILPYWAKNQFIDSEEHFRDALHANSHAAKAIWKPSIDCRIPENQIDAWTPTSS